jgi:hypothetical protein
MIHLFWGYGKLYTRADQLYEAYMGSRNVPRVDEAGSSQRCIRCGSMNTSARGRLFKCKDCGYEAHKDVVGCGNIDAVRNGGGRVNGMMAHPLLLRWDRTLGAWKHKDRSQRKGENLPTSVAESVNRDNFSSSTELRPPLRSVLCQRSGHSPISSAGGRQD